MKLSPNLKSHLWSAAAGFVIVAGGGLALCAIIAGVVGTVAMAPLLTPVVALAAGVAIFSAVSRIDDAADKYIEKAPAFKASSYALACGLTLSGMLKGAFLVAALHSNAPPEAPVVEKAPQTSVEKAPFPLPF
jgi:hypothetical protein